MPLSSSSFTILLAIPLAAALCGCGGSEPTATTKHALAKPDTSAPPAATPDPPDAAPPAEPPPLTPTGKLRMDPLRCPIEAMAAGATCNDSGISCELGDDLDAICNQVFVCDPSAGAWTSGNSTARCPTPAEQAVVPGGGCPDERPRFGATCDSKDEQRVCAYGACALNATVQCEGGSWQPHRCP